LKALIEAHDKVVLQLSGGKDSLACLHLAKPWWDKITVMWTNTGDSFPETVEQMAAIKAMVPTFLEVRTDQPAQIRENGWPSDVIPVRATRFGRLLTSEDEAPVIQGWPLCCGANIWTPMFEATVRLGATLVIRGTRKSDRRAAKSDTEVICGVTYHCPIWDWTAAEVFAHLDYHGLLPAHYSETETSLDCMHCTAYLDENAKKMRFIERKYSAVSVEIQTRLRTMRDLVSSEIAHIERAVV